jgi:phage shock protein PspC (stress-responsive transcriptional regulator)
MNDTKICPYCAEEVRAEAIKCKHCSSAIGRRGSVSEWYRTSNDRMVAGVCGGLALQFGVPTALLRLAFVLMTLGSVGVGVLIYAVLWVVMPQDEWVGELDPLPGDLRDR